MKRILMSPNKNLFLLKKVCTLAVSSFYTNLLSYFVENEPSRKDGPPRKYEPSSVLCYKSKQGKRGRGIDFAGRLLDLPLI